MRRGLSGPAFNLQAMKPWKIKLWKHDDLALALEKEKQFADRKRDGDSEEQLVKLAAACGVSADGRSRDAMRIELESENQRCQAYGMRVGTINGGPPPLGLDMILAGLDMPCVRDVFGRSTSISILAGDRTWSKPYWPEAVRELRMIRERLAERAKTPPFAMTIIADTLLVSYADMQVKSAKDALTFAATHSAYIPATAKVLDIIPGSARVDQQLVHCVYVVWDVPAQPYLAVLDLAIETCEYVMSKDDMDKYTLSIG